MQTQPTIIKIPWIAISPSPLNALVRGEIKADDPDIKELAASILTQGILQPLTVVVRPPHSAQATYELVLGERRWLATQSLGSKAPLLPCQVRPEMDEVDQLLLMGVENLQRKNLSPITEATYYKSLLERGLALEQIIQQLGRTYGLVTGRLELLKLAPQVQHLIHTKSFPLTAAKHLYDLPADIQVEVAQKMMGRRTRDIGQVVKLVQKELAAPALAPTAVGKTVDQAKRTVTADTPSYKTQTQELKTILARLAVYIQVTGQLLAECALTLEDVDPELSLLAGVRAQVIEEAIMERFSLAKKDQGQEGQAQ